jgi:hypothetical protein
MSALTLDVAYTRYRDKPSLFHAIMYLATLCQYMAGAHITSEQFLGGVTDVVGYLTDGKTLDQIAIDNPKKR